MTMSVEGVIHADIPAEGKFSMALYRIRHWLEYQRWINVGVDEINSLCASFEALLELAKGTDDNIAFNSYQAGYEKGKEHERLHILSEVRRIVEEENAAGYGMDTAQVDWLGVWRSFKYRLRELEAKG